jgi:ubiquinone/menaquinone biosynthesis C-methylase UbiE
VKFNEIRNIEYWNTDGLLKKFDNPNLVLAHRGLIAKSDRILDVGCGYGRTLVELQQSGFDNLFGVDNSENMIGLARKATKLSEDRLKASSCDCLPFPDKTFEAVLLFAVLNCLPDVDREAEAISECSRVLKSGDYLMINDFLADESQSLVSEADRFGPRRTILVDGKCTMRHTTVARISKMLFGLEVVDQRIAKIRSMNGNLVNLVKYILRSPN